MKRNAKTLGFLPRAALDDYIQQDGILGAKTDDNQLVAYLLYAAYPDYFRIAHLCVLDRFRSKGIARCLIHELRARATTQTVIRLRCRRDYPAHELWPKLGFSALDEKPGRSSDRVPLTLWCLTLASNDQLDLFRTTASDDTLDVIIDAHVFFSFDEPDNDNTIPSKALLSDFLIDSLNLWITDELFNEIARKDDDQQRARSRERAYRFSRVDPPRNFVDAFEATLTKVLPSNTPSQKSDIRQLANAAASDVSTFVTRDNVLLKKSKDIFDITNLHVLSPTGLIISLHGISERQSYTADRVSGLDLSWRRLNSDDLATLQISPFLDQGERQGPLRARLESLLARPADYFCELLWTADRIAAIRVFSCSVNKVLTVSLARVAGSADRSLFGRFLIADTVTKAVKLNLHMVTFEETSLTSSLTQHLIEMGFIKCGIRHVRFCLSYCLSRSRTLSIISELGPECADNYVGVPNVVLGRTCSPLCVEETDEAHFLIPIRPGFAISLVDGNQAADDLFGGDTSVLLRWDNVYYRHKTHHHVLMPPARLLWYVSRPRREIVAVSHLDTVEIDTPKVLFRKFRRFGILKWEDLYKICGGNPSKEIMALRFSHTFPFRAPISLASLRSVFKEDRVNLVLQSPLKITLATFKKIFALGFPER